MRWRRGGELTQETLFQSSPCKAGREFSEQVFSRIEPMNPCASFHLPLLHTLVEERVGERRLFFRWEVHGEEVSHPLIRPFTSQPWDRRVCPRDSLQR
jgi:hypothetical protein